MMSSRELMLEFLIRRSDGEWFDLPPPSELSQVLKPTSVPSQPTPGWGTHRIKIPNGVISFSNEDPGIQVSFEEYTGSEEEATKIVEEILASIESATGQRGRIVPL
jgi:hypothetical protein